MKRKNLQAAAGLLLALGALIASGAACAAGEEGPYWGLSVGSSHNGSDSPTAPSDRNDASYKLYSGFRLSPNFGMEVGYAKLGDFRTSNGRLRSTAVFVDALAYVDLMPRLSAFGKIGLFNASLHREDSVDGYGRDRGNNIKVGAGLQYQLTETISLRTEWERYKLDTDIGKPAIDHYTFGLQMRF